MIKISDFYRPYPKQQQFHQSPAKFRLFGGAVGPGKSTALLMEAVRFALEYPKSTNLLLRKTFPELERDLIGGMRRLLPLELYSYNEGKHIASFPNGSSIRFGFCEHAGDIYQYLGSEFLFIGIDEATMFDYEIFDFLKSRNRVPPTIVGVDGSRPRPCIALASNPGGPGSDWVHSLFIKHKPPSGLSLEGYNPEDFDFIPATIYDGPFQDDSEYIASLKSMAPDLRKRFLDGDWGLLAGQYFSNFSPESHLADFESLAIKSYHPRWISIDWAYSPHHTVITWHMQCEKLLTGGARPVVLTYRNFAIKDAEPWQVANEVARLSMGEEIRSVYLSPDAFARKDSEHTIALKMGDVLRKHNLPRPIPADNDREGGWMLMHQMLTLGEWYISPECELLIEALPTAVRSEKKPGDIEKRPTLADDVLDATRYGLKSYLSPGRKPALTELNEKLQAIRTPEGTPDYNRIFFTHQREKARLGAGTMQRFHLGRRN